MVPFQQKGNLNVDLIDPTIDYETVRCELADRSFTPGLSEIIIADRIGR